MTVEDFLRLGKGTKVRMVRNIPGCPAGTIGVVREVRHLPGLRIHNVDVEWTTHPEGNSFIRGPITYGDISADLLEHVEG